MDKQISPDNLVMTSRSPPRDDMPLMLSLELGGSKSKLPSLLAARDLPKAMVCSRLLGPADRGEPRLHFLFSSLLNEAFLGFFSFLAFL